jgi:spore coat polysaccharide biosynthesis predicted glycosyltransferase SpsG
MTLALSFYCLRVSLSQFERECLGFCYVSKSDAENSIKNEKELVGKLKTKTHNVKYKKYDF